MTEAFDVAMGLADVRSRIVEACTRAARDPASVRLVAASKFQTAEAIRAAYAHGQREFGENYVQELVHKAGQLEDLTELRWHVIGRLQTNKVKDVLQASATVQSIDSVRLCEALGTRAEQAGRQIEVFVQVNVSDEPQKAGAAVSELPRLFDAIRARPALNLRGLMAIPRASEDPAEIRAAFQKLRRLAHDAQLSELSMGMSDDLELAIEEGATLVRVGTALFGARPSQPGGG
jgi:pyridoxal phosphate enzyme (YggS family)